MRKLYRIFFVILLLSIITSKPTLGSKSGSWKWDPRRVHPEDGLISVYLFNVTNPQETINGSKPILAQVGPYVYTEQRERFNISTTDMNTVKFQERKTYTFVPEKSNGLESDTINFVNLPMVSAITMLRNVPYMGAGFIETIIKHGEQLVLENVKVGDILYDGIHVPVYIDIMKTLGETPPPQMEGGRFALFKGKNGTDDGVLEVQVGGDYKNRVTDIVSWQNKTELKYWTTSKCNQLKGRTDGTVFPPNIKKDSVLYFYFPEVCRSLSLVFNEEKEHLSVPGYRFIFPDSMLEDPEENSDNICYCHDYDDFDNDFSVCHKKGVIDLFPCRSAPLVSSFPHFLDADATYFDKVMGLNPNRANHQSSIVVEPITGTLLQSSIKFQLNVHTSALGHISKLKHIPDYLFPVVWVDQSFSLSPEASEALNDEKNMSGSLKSGSNDDDSNHVDFHGEKADQDNHAIGHRFSVGWIIVYSTVIICQWMWRFNVFN